MRARRAVRVIVGLPAHALDYRPHVRATPACTCVSVAAAVTLGACGGAPSATRYATTLGAIHGVARDHDTGTLVAHAAIFLRATGQLSATKTSSKADGTFVFAHLAPGTYSINAEFAGQPIDVEHIDVPAGATVPVDLDFTLGRPDPIQLVFGDPKSGAIDRYHPPALAKTLAMLEGAVQDVGNHAGVGGAVVTAVGPSGTLQTVTDDDGRYRFASVAPGIYVLSAYYSIANRGQFEVRRSQVHAAGGEAVIVPLWIESAAQ